MLLLPSLHGGGAERVAVHLMRHMDPARFDVRMGLLRKSGPYVPMVDPARIDAPEFGRRFLDFDQGNDKVYELASLLPAAVLTPAHVLNMLRRFRPHVVISFRKGMSVIALTAVTLYGRSRVRFIAREGNNTFAVIDDELRGARARALVRKITAFCYRSADRLLTICHEMAADLERELGLPGSHLRTIHNAVDIGEVERLAAAASPLPIGEPYLVAAGRLDRQKGLDVLMRAFALSVHRNTHRLVLIGKGREEPALRALAAELGIAHRVDFAGWQDNPFALMSRAQLFVLPSRWEGFGNVVIEAMASGAPVVVSDCSYGPKEIVRHEQDGLVVPRDDFHALRDAIDRVLDDAALRGRFARAGRARAREFDVPVVVGRYEALFSELAAELPALRAPA